MNKREKNMIGICCICLQQKKLTFEHVPPRSAFNKATDLISYKFDINKKTWIPSSDNVSGIGDYTLCEKCNNNTGGMYGRAFCDFINYMAHELNISIPYREYRKITYKGYHHRIYKQILTMFCSINTNFSQNTPNLKKYILEKNCEEKPENIYLYIFSVNRSQKFQSGFQGRTNVQNNSSFICSELLFWPLGYILSLNPLLPGDIQDAYLTDISNWNDFEINTKHEVSFKIAKNYRLTCLPLDFRSKDEIELAAGRQIPPPGTDIFINYEI